MQYRKIKLPPSTSLFSFMKYLCAWNGGEYNKCYFYSQIQSQNKHSIDEQMMFLSLPLTAIINLPGKKARLKIVSIFSLIMKLVCIYY